MTPEFTIEFIDQSIHYMDENTPKIKRCLDELDETEIWKRPNDASNSVGNLVLHLCGNITQWVISSLGKAEDRRERDKEFSATGGYSKTELWEKFIAVIEKAKDIIQHIDTDEILRKRLVQGYHYSGIGIIIHITEHYSYHTGQIVFWTKLLKDKDLGFYAGTNLNVRNEPG
jgi:uncharacterized damage-inducible protein DinB